MAQRAELPASAIHDDSRMLSDLHLNSISVGQLVAEAAKRLNLPPLIGLTDFANATVGRVAQALEELARSGATRSADEKNDPESGEPVRRVITGGFGTMSTGNAPRHADMQRERRGGGSCGTGCGCH